MDWRLPYPSQRQPVLADSMVATSQPLAVQAGLEMLRAGGNAVDAAIAAAAALTVVEPTSNGIGGDLFAIVWDGSTVHGLNASGRSPFAIDAARLQAEQAMPLRGWDTVTVPGAVSGWVALHQRFARLDLEQLLSAAVRYARDGYPVAPATAAAWHRAAGVFAAAPDMAPFLPQGRAPAAGERFAFPAQATTLEGISRSAGDSFYRGSLAQRISDHASDGGGPLSLEDLAAHEVEWVRTLSQPVGDVVLHELPPNGQGIAALEALALLERTDVGSHAPDSAGAIHLQAEAMKLAFTDAHAHVADPDAMTVSAAALPDIRYLDGRVSLLDPDHATDPRAGEPRRGGTVYLCTADRDGMMVSLIQSNYYGFGSGIVVPDTGISLHNRGAGFVTTRGHPNVVAPRKRPFHTIIPALTCDQRGTAAMAFGIMGGHMQPQGHVQMMLRTAVWGQNPQAALDAPRWRVETGRTLALEDAVAPDVRGDLAARGHEIVRDTTMGGFGGGQAIMRLGGSWLGASDPRKEGQAAGF